MLVAAVMSGLRSVCVAIDAGDSRQFEAYPQRAVV